MELRQRSRAPLAFITYVTFITFITAFPSDIKKPIPVVCSEMGFLDS